ncbi:aldehyde dehydrogenase family protein [Rhodococcus sp. ACPA1]|uniref:aldehyde dehydrogenase family protein n=1 Tax=Rhodococcus sp. ACPA1 TaxID=2028572 RepID=UPI000BB14B06|nr:aldehyde dehydrogenase family protein [Rhodococcus sp. ACPA1]PBC54751.1 gamma-aminobutyraldehyde dehydrogenase [Rhodococcus sp. ACPA1]
MTLSTIGSDQRSVLHKLAGRVTGNFVNGRWTPSNSPETITVLDPSTGREIGTVPASSAADVDAAVAAARAAQPGWAALTPAARSKFLLDIATLTEELLEEISVIEAVDAGKPITAVRDEELPGVIDAMRFFAGAARTLPAPSSGDYLEGVSSIMRREPIGVAAGITPWNYPLLQAVAKVFPALATGNTYVLKPAETTPYSTAWLAEIIARVLPDGVFNVVFGTGAVAGDALARHPKVDVVSFTGSIDTGRKVGIAAADGVKKAIMELGGNSPVIVFGDADLESALDAIATGGLYNTGQECMSASRVIVHAPLLDAVVDGLKERCSREKLGDVLDPTTTVGPMNSALQRDRVLAKINGRSTGARVVSGGESCEGDGFFFPPTIVVGVADDEELVQEEIFGPVFTVQTFETEEQAIALANGTRYGLASSLFTRNVGTATRVQNALNFGTVWVNNHLVFAADLPVSGFGASGIGTENAEAGLLEYTRLKHVMVDNR